MLLRAVAGPAEGARECPGAARRKAGDPSRGASPIVVPLRQMTASARQVAQMNTGSVSVAVEWLRMPERYSLRIPCPRPINPSRLPQKVQLFGTSAPRRGGPRRALRGEARASSAGKAATSETRSTHTSQIASPAWTASPERQGSPPGPSVTPQNAHVCVPGTARRKARDASRRIVPMAVSPRQMAASARQVGQMSAGPICTGASASRPLWRHSSRIPHPWPISRPSPLPQKLQVSALRAIFLSAYPGTIQLRSISDYGNQSVPSTTSLASM